MEKEQLQKLQLPMEGVDIRKHRRLRFKMEQGRLLSAQVTQKTDKQIADEAKAKVEKIIKSRGL